MNREIGIVLVHGIGNQAPGQLAREMTIRLRDEQVFCEPKLHTSAHSTDATSDPSRVGGALAYRFKVQGTPVQLREANWAPLSHPDNPPRVRLVPYILGEYIDTVSSAWVASPIGWFARRLARRRTPAHAMIFWGSLAFAITVLIVLAVRVWEKIEVDLLLGIALVGIVLYLTYRNMRHRWLVLRDATRVRRVAICVLYIPIAYVWGFVQFFSAEMLLFMAIPVIAAVVLSFVVLPVVQLFVELGRLAGACRMNGVRRWVHRLGCAMVVLPVHTFLQATKATGNLISILFCEKHVKVRAIATGWLVGVYFGFLLVMSFSELWILFPFFPILGPLLTHQAIHWGLMAAAVISFPAYLLLLKIFLPAIDLLLDIGNYHIASTEDRSLFHQEVEKAVQSLRDSRCTEIHIVAHSLGSVIVYDWLGSASTDLPLRALHTIGSPLNKFWYIDHARRRRLADATCLANFPACQWTNYWAFSDVVSGALARYKATGAQICDIRVRWLGPVLASHVRYWKNDIVLAGIRNEIAKSEGSDSATSVGIANI